MDFTLRKYSALLDAIGKGDYRISSGKNILRHDVDRSIPNAMRMAKLEAEHGIKATYYFRVPRTFDVKAIDKIHRMGHEIGYHYEAMDKAHGNHSEAIQLFTKEWDLFKRWNTKTICMHGNPLSRHNNRDLWKNYDFKKFGVEKEAYSSIDFAKTNYFTDTGRSWNSKTASVKDKTGRKLWKVHGTDHLIHLIKKGRIKNFYILAHPCRWNDNLILWSKELVWQNIKNFGKRLL